MPQNDRSGSYLASLESGSDALSVPRLIASYSPVLAITPGSFWTIFTFARPRGEQIARVMVIIHCN